MRSSLVQAKEHVLVDGMVSCKELCKCVDCRNSITTKELDSDDEESDEE